MFLINDVVSKDARTVLYNYYRFKLKRFLCEFCFQLSE